MLVEKLSTTGGNSAINGGQYAAYTSERAAELQQKLGLEPDTAEKHIEDTIKGGDNMSNPALVREMVYASPVYFDLLLDNGLQIRDTLARPGGHYGYRTYVTENQVGSDITNLQLKMLKETSATIELETKLVEIYRTRDEANRVVGIRVATADGYKTIEAKKGVIMATGGFSSNVEMRETPGSVPDRGSADHQHQGRVHRRRHLPCAGDRREYHPDEQHPALSVG